MKALKLPPYNEDKDDLDANLSRSGRACQDLMSMQPEHWSTHHWPDYCKARPYALEQCKIETVKLMSSLFTDLGGIYRSGARWSVSTDL